jgi:hypothetical protein
MALLHRPMCREDVEECVEILASHPVFGPRYGAAIDDVGRAWLQLLGGGATSATVLEDSERAHEKILFVGVAVFVRDSFLHELKRAPFWLGPELTERVVRRESPVLTPRELRAANSTDGLNLVTWAGCIRPAFVSESALYRVMMQAFIENHRGFLWKEVIANQMESEARLLWTLETGGRLWDPRTARYLDSRPQRPGDVIARPHVVGVTRSMELGRPGSWVGALFSYQPPSCGLRPSEQRLLAAALNGATDEELSDALGVSVSTVKKTWASAYERAAANLPKWLPDGHSGDGHEAKRGKEKKRRLLAYVREHREELRPHDMKLVSRSSG